MHWSTLKCSSGNLVYPRILSLANDIFGDSEISLACQLTRERDPQSLVSLYFSFLSLFFFFFKYSLQNAIKQSTQHDSSHAW
jgi:hypothetical protein